MEKIYLYLSQGKKVPSHKNMFGVETLTLLHKVCGRRGRNGHYLPPISMFPIFLSHGMLQLIWCGVSNISLIIHSFVHSIYQSTFGGSLTTIYRIEREKKEKERKGKERKGKERKGKERGKKGRKGSKEKKREGKKRKKVCEGSVGVGSEEWTGSFFM